MPRDAWTFWGAVVAIVVLVQGALVLGLSGFGFDPRMLAEDPAKHPLASSVLGLTFGTLSCELATLLVLVFAVRWRGLPARAVFPIHPPSVLGTLGALLLTFGLLPIAQAASDLGTRVAGSDARADAVLMQTIGGASPGEMVLVLFALALTPAVVEELAFRGYVTRCYPSSSWGALFIPPLLFGAFHLNLPQMAATCVLGFAFGLARLATGSVLTPMLVHAVYNGSILLGINLGLPILSEELQTWHMAAGLTLALVGARLLLRPSSSRAAGLGSAP
jgi:membrane protease YdiL (CAAX protease family)